VKPYYQDEAVQLYCGDCRDVLPTLAKVDHVITAPPYSDITHAGARGGAGNTELVTFASVTAHQVSDVLALSVPRRWVIATVDWRHVLHLETWPPAGLKFVRFGVWVKPNGAPQFTGDRPATGWEAIAILHADAKGRMSWNNGGHHAVYTYPKVNGEHPTAKPDGLIRAFVSDFTDPGDTILDPFAGSGTTLVAAKRLGRKAIGIELSPAYCDVIVSRLRQGSLLSGEGVA
jgi:site-specific DNA-methyltransferase (adenine-specific)